MDFLLPVGPSVDRTGMVRDQKQLLEKVALIRQTSVMGPGGDQDGTR